MKVKVIINSCIIVMCFAFFSCSQDEEAYSCNKEVNVWVKENLSDIQQMSRSEWINIGNIESQRAVYRVFTPEQKQALWEGKIREVLNNVEWTQQETKHIEELLSLITNNSSIFEDQENNDKVEIDLYKWKEYAIEELEWTPEVLYALIYTPESMTPDKQIAVVINSVSRLRSGSESNCDCNGSTSPPESSGDYFMCTRGIHQCNTGSGCTSTSWGCGQFWSYTCNGTCV
jgi:hypothetical protein